MTYGEALDYLASLEGLGIRPGLERTRALLKHLGDPHRTFPSVLIAGTNGKGSVAAFLSSILGSAGLDPGVYSSPHLVRFEERIAVLGLPIAREELAALTDEVAAAILACKRDGGEVPTYFEATTALAFLHFSRRRVPIAVLEVGLGGRFDATNVVEPLACAITPVAMDHMEWLGRTLPEIAHQKAGIIRPGVPVVVARQERGVLRLLRDEADRLQAPRVEAAACRVEPPGGLTRFPDPPVFSLTTAPGRRYENLAIPLRGRHQIGNATVAVLLAELLADGRLAAPGLDAASIARGLARASWPGRIEIVPGRPDLLLDGAHNPAGCETLVAYLREHQAGRPIALLFAAMRDKPAGEMLGILGPLARAVVLTSLPVPRGESPSRLQSFADEHGLRSASEPDLERAFGAARAAAGETGLVVASGSLYLVGEIKRMLSGR